MSSIEAEIMHPRFANFLKVKLPGEESAEWHLSVAELTTDQAGEVWDSWRDAWLEHCKSRAALKAVVESET